MTKRKKTNPKRREQKREQKSSGLDRTKEDNWD